MRVLIFVDDVLNATFGVPLELSVQHLADGDSVDLVVCRGALFACPSNSRHDSLACRLCRSRLDSALSAPALSGVRVHEVTFTEEDLKFDEPVFRRSMISKVRGRWSEFGIRCRLVCGDCTH